MIANVRLARLRAAGRRKDGYGTHAGRHRGQGGRLGDPDALRVEHITKRFGAVTALHDVNLHLSRGEVLGLLGDNGAGKSTLLKIMCGFQPPTSGRIVLNGEEIGSSPWTMPVDSESTSCTRTWR